MRFFERHGFTRNWAVTTVILLIVAVLIIVIWIALPLLIKQVGVIAAAIPGELARLEAEGWFNGVNDATNGLLEGVTEWVAKQLKDPATWAILVNGLLHFGVSLISTASSLFFAAVLTIYFVGTYDQTRRAAYRLVAASHRGRFSEITDRILGNVGKYLSGMVILAFMNATYSTILLVILGVPGAFLLGVVAFFITIIPLVGTVLTTIALSIITFLHSPPEGLIMLIAMLIYMQVEAYILTPRVMSKAVKIPGSVVLISALAGGTLAGLPGALIAIPFSAGILIVITDVVMPTKDKL